MKKKVHLAPACICIAGLFVLSGVVILKNRTRTPEQVIKSPPAAIEIRQDPEFIKTLLNGVQLRHGTASDGLLTIGYNPVTEGQSILEVHFLKRDLDGRLVALPLDGFNFERYGSYGIHGAAGIRMAIENAVAPFRQRRH